MAFTKRTFVGRGMVWLASYDGTIPYFRWGNTSKLTLSITEKLLEMPDYTSPGGGDYDAVYLIDSAEIQATVMEYQAQGLAIGSMGTAYSDATAVIADEVLTVPSSLDSLVPFAKMPDLSVAPVITNSAGSTTYVAGTDYIQTRAGIIPLSTGAIAASASLKGSYTSANADRIETMTAAGRPYRMLFEGLNEADSGKTALLVARLLKFSPAKELAMLTDGWGQMDLVGKCLKDLTVTTPGLSQYVSLSIQK